MKKFTLIILNCTLFFLLNTSFSRSQGTWTQKANVFTSARAGVTGFSIGNKGYMGTGWLFGFTPAYYNDFWEWDQTSSAWTQKANFAGSSRGDALGFSIGSKGYIVTGIVAGFALATNELWEWDQATNTWSQKATFPGITRSAGAGFSIGLYGYAGLGYNGGALNDLWQYSQVTNSWTQMANIPVARFVCAAFSIGTLGYVCTGIVSGVTYLDDVWEFDPANNSWSQKASFPGGTRAYAAGFSIGSKGYFGTGSNGTNSFSDFWSFDPASNLWTQKASYLHAVTDIDQSGFSIGCKGYFGTGATEPGTSATYYNDFWEYDPDTCSLTGIDVNPNNQFTLTIGPNPFSEKLNISINSNQPSEIIIYDMNSKKVFYKTFTNSVSVNTQSFAKGIYIYEVKNKNGYLNKGKIVKP
jgi:hypothetical protein